ncbi:MAG TPA: acetyl-CoA hydrolase/transferase C-terminal domain-containing protein [Actinomycetes bacterium]|nr:acetyl-CoA hydrolase/transferase C-terminal domain-containing protein [Actinomycetes bacterium]
MRTVSVQAMVGAVRARGGVPRVVVSGNHATPWPVVAALDEGLAEWTLHMLNPQRGVPVRDGIRLETCFVGPGMRDAPTLAYIPSRLSMLPSLLRTHLPPDVVVLHTSTPRRGRVSMGTEVNILPAAVEAAHAHGGLVVAAMNPRMPYTYGDSVLDLDQVDLAVEIDDELSASTPVPLDDASMEIGARVADRVLDGATIQAGIGLIPDAALAGLASRRELRIWSETIGDGVLALEEKGALDTNVPIGTSFLFGTAELYSWVDRNRRVRMLRTETANNPARIALNPQLVSINSALQVDLHAQANAAHIRSRPFSGFGGQPDFVTGALHSPGGQALIALRSWHPKADVSSIVPYLQTPVTSFQHTAVVTEHGVAELIGRTQEEQARALIEEAADPRAREELRAGARTVGLGAAALG